MSLLPQIRNQLGRLSLLGSRYIIHSTPRPLLTTSLVAGRIHHPIKGCYRHMVSSSSSPAVKATTTTTSGVPLPTYQQLQILALRSSIPMIGFGFMDNIVMITAGEAIDSTFGVAFGLSTMAAAGLGQCCSDVVGVTSGGIVDAAVSRLRLPHHGLGPKQLDLRVSRLCSTLGACLGVFCGCLLGMSILLFMDTDRAERARKAKELQSIFETIMSDRQKNFHAERTTLFMLDEEKKELWSRVATGTSEIIKLPATQGIAGACVTTGELINIPDVYKDSRFDQSVDDSTGFVTKSILAVPIKSEEGEILGVIEVCNKKNADGSLGEFGDCDEKVLKMLATHVSCFITIVHG
eukprot:scaffold4031_cov135-Cylindrotheca_fusiformis.AAC.13